MASFPPRSSLLLILFSILYAFSFLVLLPAAGADTAADLVAELEALRTHSPSGVIHLDDPAVARFLTSVPTPRPYSLVVFFDAAQLRSKPELHLPQLRSEFGLVSAAFAARHRPDPAALSRVFFCDFEFGESQRSFARFGVSSLPHVRHVAPPRGRPESLGSDAPIRLFPPRGVDGRVRRGQDGPPRRSHRAPARRLRPPDGAPRGVGAGLRPVSGTPSVGRGHPAARSQDLDGRRGVRVLLQRLRGDAQHHPEDAALPVGPRGPAEASVLLPGVGDAAWRRGLRRRFPVHCGGFDDGAGDAWACAGEERDGAEDVYDGCDRGFFLGCEEGGAPRQLENGVQRARLLAQQLEMRLGQVSMETNGPIARVSMCV